MTDFQLTHNRHELSDEVGVEGPLGRGLAAVEAGGEEVDLAEVERDPGHRLSASVKRHVLEENCSTCWRH